MEHPRASALLLALCCIGERGVPARSHPQLPPVLPAGGRWKACHNCFTHFGLAQKCPRTHRSLVLAMHNFKSTRDGRSPKTDATKVKLGRSPRVVFCAGC